jgi:transcription-repair coupling factor (superfamily II helicase)
LRLLAGPLGAKKIDASSDAIVIHFVPEPPFDTAKLIGLLQKSRTMRLAGPAKLRIDERTVTVEARLARLREVFRALQ